MGKIKFIVVIFLTLLASVSLSAAGDTASHYKKAEEAKEASAEIMPEFLGNVYLGMSREELRERRDVEGAYFLGPKTKPSSTYIWHESLDGNSSFFTHALYTLWGDDAHLTDIKLLSQASNKLVSEELPTLIQGSIKKWGSEYAIKTTKTRPHTEVFGTTVLTWNKDNAVIALLYPSKFLLKQDKNAGVSLLIIERSTKLFDMSMSSLKTPSDLQIKEMSEYLKELLATPVAEADLFR